MRLVYTADVENLHLIDTDDTETLEELGIDRQIENQYAILSHTWLPTSKEVTFETFDALKASWNPPRLGVDFDLSSARLEASRDRTRSLEGYGKIKMAAKKAKEQGINLLWVDTCCIDKSSSAELSESINSMYRWYQQAKVCYAYLADVRPVEDFSLMGEESEFAKSRWFKRGWTLQELIGPGKVEFYAEDWSPVSTKQVDNIEFCRILSKITEIDVDVLAGVAPLSEISAADKMRWAARRETKRPEDRAYSLMGLFDVNMPLLYGEGSRAFIRLQEEILKDTDDHSLFLWALKPSGPSQPDGLYGLLADSPEAFSHLGIASVRRLPPLASHKSLPATVTNQGLMMSVALSPVAQRKDEYAALLDCTVFQSLLQSGRKHACIFLRKLWGDQFARVSGPASAAFGVGFTLADPEVKETRETMTTIYVKQRPFYALPEVSINTYPDREEHAEVKRSEGEENAEGKEKPKGGGRLEGKEIAERTRATTKSSPSFKFSVIGAFPPQRFSSTQYIVRTANSAPGHATVILRLGYPDQPSWPPVADVCVGFKRNNREWEACYEVRAFDGKPIQNVFEKNTMVGVSSKDSSQINPGLPGRVQIYATEAWRRGRRFVQLDIFDTEQVDTAVLRGKREYRHEKVRHASLTSSVDNLHQDIERRIMEAIRQCSYYDKRGYISAAGHSPPDVIRIAKDQHGFSNRVVPDIVSKDKPHAELLQALYSTKTSKIKLLISQNKDLLECETEEFDNFRPVHWAATWSNDRKTCSNMKTLVGLKADLGSRTKAGLTAIHVAALAGKYQVVLFLLKKNRMPWKSSEPHYENDIVSSTGDTLSHLIAADMSSRRYPRKKRNAVFDILKATPEIRTNKRGEIPIHRAAARGNLGFLEQDDHCRRLFLPGDVYVRDAAGRTPLFHAACNGSIEMINRLLELDSMIRTVDNEGRGVLHAAVMANQPEAVQFLLKKGADPNEVTRSNGLTPLHFACLYGFDRCAEALIAQSGTRRADVNQTSVDGVKFQPIHLAVANGHIECLKALAQMDLRRHDPCDSYLKLEKPPSGMLHNVRLVFLPHLMAPLELAVSLGDRDMASQISSLTLLSGENSEFDLKSLGSRRI